MKWIINIDKKYKIPYILSNIFLIFFDSIGFISPILMGYLVDAVTIHQNYDMILTITIVLLLFSCVKVMGSYICYIKLADISQKITSEIKKKCYQNVNILDHYFFERNDKGELMTNFTSDIGKIRHHLTSTIKTIMATLVIFICSFCYLLTIHAPFTFVLLTPGILCGISSYHFAKKVRPKYSHLRDLSASVNDLISDNIEANKVVKTFAIENLEIQQMKKRKQKYVDSDIEVGKIENRFFAKIDLYSYLMSAIFLIFGGYLFIQENLTMGELLIFNSYLYNLRSPFIRLGSMMNRIQRYLVASSRVKKLVDATPKISLDGKIPLPSLLVPIEFKDVRIVFDDHVVLEGLNFTIHPYETVAFIGSTGSGKSSIVNLLLGFLTPESGEILMDGRNYLDYKIKDIREKIGYVTQNAFLFSDTIYNNIGYGTKNLTKEEAQKYASLACCHYIDKLDKGLDTIIGEKGVGLSGGEKQRLSLARALAVHPDILLLDDITSALDIETEEKINESINHLEYQSTKVIIASKIVSVMHADKIYCLNQGKIIESGTHEELLKQKGYYYELYNIQKGEM